jgi:D-aspartate ligase
LFPVRDDDVLLCSRHRQELFKHYAFIMPSHEIVEALVTKDGLQRMAEASLVEAPRMFVPGSREELAAKLNDLPYPVILKPVFSPSWLRVEITSLLREGPLSNPPKVALCRDPGELMRTYDRIAAFDDRMIVQEVIPGEDERLAYCCFYVDRERRPRAVFAGRKLRILPVGFGSASYVRSFHDPDLERVTLRLLAGTGYRGLGGVEFKKDARDGRYKLIEFNARFGLWDSLATRCGMDIPYLAYQDALGRTIETRTDYRDGVPWLDSQRDIRAFLIYRRLGRLKTSDWLRSLAGEKAWAVYAPDDRKPGLIATLHLFDRPWTFFKKKLGGDS